MAYGLVPLRYQNGSPITGGLAKGVIDKDASTAFFKGDLIGIADSEENDNGATGRVRGGFTVTVDTTGVINAGIVSYFEYTDANGKFQVSKSVTAAEVAAASTAALEITVYYTPISEQLICKCIADDVGTTLARTHIHSNFAFETATGGSAITGLSGGMLDSSSTDTTSTLPLRLVGLYNVANNDWGNTAGTVEVEVMFASTVHKAGVAGLTS